MVTELAPVVLLLRNAIARGDMLIIDEPEAHLHPAAQTEMAKTLGRLVRAGVRVVVTTHSDWLLMEIGNLIREGELEQKTSESISEGPLPSSLQPSDVGVWLFRKDETSASSTVKEIPFDRIEGVEPREYEDVAEALYNRSAGLQNRLAETVK
jgi:AAA15 family ATPase/GTPase